MPHYPKQKSAEKGSPVLQKNRDGEKPAFMPTGVLQLPEEGLGSATR